jgi:hypothetical protein
VSCELCGSVYEREICTDCGSQRGRRRRRDEDDQRSEDKQMMRTKGGYIQVHTGRTDGIVRLHQAFCAGSARAGRTKIYLVTNNNKHICWRQVDQRFITYNTVKLVGIV